MSTSPMSPRRGTMLAAALLGCIMLPGCSKSEQAPRERDPNATTMRMTGPDGVEVIAEIVETENGMRTRIEGDGEERTIEMEMPDGFRKPGTDGAHGDGSQFGERWQKGREDIRASMREQAARQDEFERKFDEDRDAFLKRFDEERRDFDRRFREDGRRFDELRKTFPPAAGKPAPTPSSSALATPPGTQAPFAEPTALAEPPSGDLQ